MEHILVTWGLAAVFVVNLISAAGIPAGSEWATIGAGALASGHLIGAKTHPMLWVVILVAIAGDMLGSIIGYIIGRAGGRPLVERLGRYVLITPKDLDRAEGWFARRGDPFVMFGRMIPLLRSFVSIVAGIGEMSVGMFVLFSGIGTVIFATVLCSVGDALGPSWGKLLHAFSDAGYVVGGVAVLVIGTVAFHRIRAARQAS